MKIKVTCKQHGNTMDGSGMPFFIAVEPTTETTQPTDKSESVWELDLSDLWCSEAKWDNQTQDYDRHDNEFQVEVIES